MLASLTLAFKSLVLAMVLLIRDTSSDLIYSGFRYLK